MDQTEKNKVSIYTKLKRLRENRGLTVDSLAKKMGENYQKVGRVERGTRTLTVDYLLKVSRALDAPLESLLNPDEPAHLIDKNSATSPPSSFTPKVLNELVILVEKNMPNIPAHLKGKLISNIYEQALKFPESQQLLFATSAFELIKFICDFSSDLSCSAQCSSAPEN